LRAILLASLITSLALAQPVPAHADSNAEAKAHYQAGRRLSAKGEFAAAMAEFEAGYEVSRLPAFLFNMGECARAMKQHADARDAYERYLAVEPNGPLAARARARLATLPAPPTATPVPPPPQPVRLHTTTEVSLAANEGTQRLDLRPAIVQHEDRPRPLWKNPWLWAGVGAVVAGTVTLYMVNRDDGGCPGACLDFR
jgi:tetratricopeptide (TPR) repeat protein